MKSIEVISRAIILNSSQILLCRNKEYNRYYLPGGHVEFGDSMEKTVYKELNEEMGLKEDQIQNLKYLDVLENFFGEGDDVSHEINLIFTASLADGTEIKSTEPHIDFEWRNVSELESIPFVPKQLISIIKNVN